MEKSFIEDMTEASNLIIDCVALFKTSAKTNSNNSNDVLLLTDENNNLFSKQISSRDVSDPSIVKKHVLVGFTNNIDFKPFT